MAKEVLLDFLSGVEMSMFTSDQLLCTIWSSTEGSTGEDDVQGIAVEGDKASTTRESPNYKVSNVYTVSLLCDHILSKLQILH